MKRVCIIVGSLAVALALAAPHARAQARFPAPTFESDYKQLELENPPSGEETEHLFAVAVMVAAMSVAAWLALRARSRRGMVVLSIASLIYFGFIRRGCICPIGSIQHVAASLADWRFVLPLSVGLLFAMPLVFALLFGRVFCAAVCPLGAIQDVVLIRPISIPPWLERLLGILPFVYLGLAVLYAMTGTGLIICRYDPFVSLFRLSGPASMLIAGGVVVALSTFVGRPYCRFLCPYGALLGVLSRWSWRRVTITPDECIVCSLCESACPFGAIMPPTPQALEEG